VLAQRIIPALDMGRFSRVLADAAVILTKYRLVRLPEVAHCLRMAVRWRYVLLELLASVCAAPAHSIGHDLARAPTQANPYPQLVGLLLHKRPKLIEFKYVSRLGRQQLFTQAGQTFGFFLSNW
jgi:hypothetical protein